MKPNSAICGTSSSAAPPGEQPRRPVAQDPPCARPSSSSAWPASRRNAAASAAPARMPIADRDEAPADAVARRRAAAARAPTAAPATGIGGLTDAHREPALVLREPVHDRPAARGGDARAAEAGDGEQHPERGEAASSPPRAASRRPAAARPTLTTRRSPTRSAARPHGSIPSIVPTFAAASTSPVCASVSPYSLRTSGRITGRPIVNTANVACAVVPTARTVQR